MMDPVCPKCNSPMEVGFLVDHTYGGVQPPQWAEGSIERSFWVGVKTSGRVQRQIETCRCTGCGFLESYAR